MAAEKFPSELPKQPKQKSKVSRREFLGMAVGAAGLAAEAIAGYPRAKEIVREIFFEDEVKKEIAELKKTLKEVYGLKINTETLDTTILPVARKQTGAQDEKKTDHQKDEAENELEEFESESTHIAGEGLSFAEQRDVLNWLVEELGKYPPEFVACLAIDEFNFVKNLHIDFEENGATLGQTFLSPRMTVVKAEEILSTKKLGRKPKFTSTFHHELYHQADGAYNLLFRDDKQWSNLNEGGKSSYAGWLWPILGKRSHKGFATAYGMSHPSEDQATVAERLMNDTEALFEEAAQDEVLAKKIQETQNRYFAWSNGKMNEQYWKDLLAGKVSVQYWEEAKNIKGVS